MYVSFTLAYKVPKTHAVREFPNELPTKYCFLNYFFLVNQAPKPDLPNRVACCYLLYFLLVFIFKRNHLKNCFPLSVIRLSLIHISEPTRLGMISYAVFCLK